MDLRHLEVFYYVYQQKSFSAAAGKLELTQPTVSAHILNLEEKLKAKLFDRSGRRVVPTHVADQLFIYARRIVDTKAAAEEAITGFLSRLEGELTLGASTIPGEYVLPELIASFRAKYPEVQLKLEISDTDAVIEAVRDLRVEIGFVGAERKHRHLEFLRVAGDELVLVAPNLKPWRTRTSIAIEELKELPLVLREPGSGTRKRFVQFLKEVGYDLCELDVVSELGSTSAVKAAVQAGLGLSAVSSLAVALELKHGILRKLAVKRAPRLARDFFLVTEKRRFRSPICRTFLPHALQALKS